MTKIGVVSKGGMLGLVLAAMAVGVTSLMQSQAYAARPKPDCGPTREWNCVVPGCPDCPEILFEGTVCEKAQFEKQTGRVCSPA
jgi:hypothetical protein